MTVELAAKYRGAGVVGVDLAGAEALYPTEGYREVFSLASRLGLNVTIHAGEAAGEESIRAALDFGAERIGHGVALKSEPALRWDFGADKRMDAKMGANSKNAVSWTGETDADGNDYYTFTATGGDP